MTKTPDSLAKLLSGLTNFKNQKWKERTFIKTSALASSAWLVHTSWKPSTRSGWFKRKKNFSCHSVFREAMTDWIPLVPYGMDAYHQQRPTIGILQPMSSGWMMFRACIVNEALKEIMTRLAHNHQRCRAIQILTVLIFARSISAHCKRFR